MYGKKPETYQDIVSMKLCIQIQKGFPYITDETMRTVYDYIVQFPNRFIAIYGGKIHFGNQSDQQDIEIGGNNKNIWLIGRGEIKIMQGQTNSGSNNISTSPKK